jgi:hypothetical protein
MPAQVAAACVPEPVARGTMNVPETPVIWRCFDLTAYPDQLEL